MSHVGAQGDGIIPSSDGPVYAPAVLPGERVRGERWGSRLDRIALIETSPDRVAPPCPHFSPAFSGQSDVDPSGEGCGGCTLQHMARPAQLAWKQDQVRAALASRGLDTVPVAPVIGLEPKGRRRVTLGFLVRRGTVQLGFAARRSHRLVPVDHCMILTDGLSAAWPGLADLARQAATLLPKDRPGEGRMHIVETETGLDIDLRLGLDGPMPDPLALQGVTEAAAALEASRLTMDGELILQWRAPRLTVSGVAIEPAPAGFLQPSREGEDALSGLVVASLSGGERLVADLYAGSGTFTFPLARRAKVAAVEADPGAVHALESGLRYADGLKSVKVLRRDLVRRPMLVKELAPFDAVVMDPPRAGAAEQVAQLALSTVGLIVSVSCNPATFARDARVLVDGGYVLESVQPVDQFVWSAHIECVGVFRRPG